MSENGMAAGEMGIREALHVLARHRIAAMLSFVGVILAAGAFLVLAKPVYEVEGRFYIGRFGTTPVYEPTLVAQRLDATFRKGGAIPGAVLIAVTPDRRDARLIRFTVRGTSPNAVQRLADDVLASVLESHSKRIEEGREPLVRELGELGKLAEGGRAVLGRHSDASGGFFATLELVSVHKRIGELEQQLRNEVEPTEVVVRPLVGKTPVSPNKGLVVVLALMGGLFAAMVMPFVFEAVLKRRKA